jgi:uncharacterized protein YecE (DUF72 family)
MEDSAQQTALRGDPRQHRAAEERLYLGTSGWSYADWEGTIYPEGLPSGSRLAEYVKRYATVEIDSSFYGTPRRSTVQKWREISPEGFLFAAKFPQEVTHERNLSAPEPRPKASCVRWQSWGTGSARSSCSSHPPSRSRHGRSRRLLEGLPEGFRYAVEVRHRSWLGSDLPEMLRERGVALTLIDYPRMPRMQEATTDFSYIRWLGDRREFPAGHTYPKKERDEDLRWWAEVVGGFLEEGKTVFAYANNHYQNHSPSTLERFLEIRRGSGR